MKTWIKSPCPHADHCHVRVFDREGGKEREGSGKNSALQYVYQTTWMCWCSLTTVMAQPHFQLQHETFIPFKGRASKESLSLLSNNNDNNNKKNLI